MAVNNSEQLKQRVERDFTYHAPGSEKVRKAHEFWNEITRSLATMMASELPEGRELSLALTALQECRMWGNAAIALNQEKITDG